MKTTGIERQVAAAAFGAALILASTGCKKKGLPPSTPVGGTTESSDTARETDRGGLEEAIALWSQGKETAATEKFIAIDWSREDLFPESSVFRLTEEQFVSLPEAEREKKKQEIWSVTIPPFRAICQHVLQTGQAAIGSKDYDKARRHLTAVRDCSHLFTDDPKALSIFQAVTRGYGRQAAEGLAKIEKPTGT